MKVHIFVATTQGLVAIQNITTIDDADISSIVSINGTSTTANISSAYHNFVKKGAGIIQQDFSACSYRINISKRIDQGNSWQLAFYLAHAAISKNMLGDGQVNIGDHVICATGEINTVTRDIQSISQIKLKQKLAATQIKQWHKQKIKVSFLVPDANAQEIDKQLPLNIKRVRNLTQALAYLPSTALANTIQTNVAQANPSQENASLDSIQAIATATATATKNSGWFNKKFRLLVVSTALVIIILSIIFWFSNDSIPLNSELSSALESNSESNSKSALDSTSVNSASNDSSKVLAPNNIGTNNQQTWQIAVLNKSIDEINEDLQPAYALIEKTITEQLIANNFDIADNSLITGSSGVTEETLLQLKTNGINLAIRFDLTVNKLEKSAKLTNTSIDTWRYELSAHLIDLTSKRKIETHTEYGEYSRKFINCDKECFSNWLATNARKLAQDMGAILNVKLKNLPRRYQFELIFQDFLVDEFLVINNQLKEMNGFLSSNLLQEFNAKNTLLHQTSSRKYLYSSYLPTDDLMRDLEQLFEQSGLSVSKTSYNSNSKNRAPSMSKTGDNVSTLVFARDNMPYFAYYIFSIIVLTSLFVLFFIVQRKRRLSITSPTENKAINTTPTQDSAIATNSSEAKPPSSKTQPLKGAVIGQGALENCYIFSSATLALGQISADPSNSFAIGYQQISRVGKQCLFSYENNQFYLEEQGSTNGSILDNIQLSAQQRITIKAASQLILGGAKKGDLSLCQLSLKAQSTSLVMQLNANVHQFVDLSNIKLAWPSMTKDLNSRWVLLAEEVSLSIDNGQIVLGCDNNDTLAYLRYQEGFYIRPNALINQSELDEVITGEVMINQEIIQQTMPIDEDSIISLNGYEFSLKNVYTQVT